MFIVIYSDSENLSPFLRPLMRYCYKVLIFYMLIL